MGVDTTALRQLGERLRRSRISVEMLTYIDGTLPLIGKVVVPHASVESKRLHSPQDKTEPRPLGGGACPVCEARRKAKREAQRRWRKKQGRDR